MLIIIARLVLPGSWFRHSSEKYQNKTGTFANSLCESAFRTVDADDASEMNVRCYVRLCITGSASMVPLTPDLSACAVFRLYSYALKRHPEKSATCIVETVAEDTGQPLAGSSAHRKVRFWAQRS